MEEITPKYPTLTNDEKLAVREAQFVLINTREQAMQAVQAAEQDEGADGPDPDAAHDRDRGE